MKRVFISLPFKHIDKNFALARLQNAEYYFIKLLHNGICPVSPIVAGIHLSEKYGVSAKFEYWDDYCVEELKTCDEVHVLMLYGWETSVEVKKELELARDRNIPIAYIPLEEI